MISLIHQMRRNFYRRGWISSVRLPCAVVSVGNLSMGGSGKTPLIDALLTALKAQGISGSKLVVVSRNYKATSRGMHWVDLNRSDAAEFYGDEPALIQSLHPDVKVIVGPSKSESARLASEEIRPDLILVDDGFQHRKLKRDLDLVLISKNDLKASIFPFGYLREGFASLHEAHWVLLNSSYEESLNLQEQIKDWVQTKARYAQTQGELEIEASVLQTARSGYAAFAGIARPERFFESLKSKIGKSPLRVWKFPDHFEYSKESLTPIEIWQKENPGIPVFHTQKDEIKLRARGEGFSNFKSVQWRLQLAGIEEVVRDVSRVMEKHRS